MSEKVTFTRREAADAAGVCLNTIDHWIKCEGLPHFRSGARVIIPRQAFIEWLNAKAKHEPV